MKYVYAIKHYYEYEFDDVIGIYASRKAALKAAERKKIKIDSGPYNMDVRESYYIERYEINN